MFVSNSELKQLFMLSMRQCVGNASRVAVALSGGKDSHTILFALLEMGITPVAYSLHVEGNESTDYKVAKRTCEQLNVEFHEVILPKVADKQKIVDLIVKYDRINKVDTECYYPIMLMLEQVKEEVLLVGITAGVMVPLSKRACIHYKKDHDKLNGWREKDWKYTTTPDMICLDKMGKEHNILVKDPFFNRAILDWFKLQTWDSLHTPNQKQVLVDLFPEYFAKVKTTPQTSMQVGDSKIREIYEPLLLDKTLNLGKRSRVQELYKDIHSRSLNVQLV